MPNWIGPRSRLIGTEYYWVGQTYDIDGTMKSDARRRGPLNNRPRCIELQIHPGTKLNHAQLGMNTKGISEHRLGILRQQTQHNAGRSFSQGNESGSSGVTSSSNATSPAVSTPLSLKQCRTASNAWLCWLPGGLCQECPSICYRSALLPSSN